MPLNSDTSANVIQPASKPFPIATEPGLQMKSSVSHAAGTDHCLVTWIRKAADGSTGPVVEGAIFGLDGSRIHPIMIISTDTCPYNNSLSNPVPVCHEEEHGSWIVAWDDGVSVYGRRVFDNGSMDSPRTLVSGEPLVTAHEHPALAYGRVDREVLLVTRESREGLLEGRRMSPDLSLIQDRRVLEKRVPGPPAVAYAQSRNSFFIAYSSGDGYLKEVTGRELETGDQVSPAVRLANIPGIAPKVAHSPALDDLVALFIDGRFDVLQIDVFGQLGRSVIGEVNVSGLAHHRVVNGLHAVRVEKGKGATVAMWYDNLFAGSQRARFRLLYDDGTLSAKRLVAGGVAFDPSGDYAEKQKKLFAAFTRPSVDGYQVFGKIFNLSIGPAT